MESTSLQVEVRTAVGKRLGALRRAGITPIHVYGKGVESLSLHAPSRELLRTLSVVGQTTPFTLRVAGDSHFVITREVQRDPITDKVIHVDFLAVSRTERMRVEVPLELQGEAPAIRLEAATFVQDLRAVEVEALPADLPSSLSVDISGLDEVDKALHARDIPLPSGVTLVSDPEALIARVVHQRIAAAEEATEEQAAGVPSAEVEATQQKSGAEEEA